MILSAFYRQTQGISNQILLIKLGHIPTSLN